MKVTLIKVIRLMLIMFIGFCVAKLLALPVNAKEKRYDCAFGDDFNQKHVIVAKTKVEAEKKMSLTQMYNIHNVKCNVHNVKEWE